MNYPLKQIPFRTAKPREAGITMIMDKGLSLREAEDMLEVSSGHIDIIKLGWATSSVTNNDSLENKLAFYREAGVPYYFGGTLFEAFYIRNQVEDYKRTLEKYKVSHMEVSDGSIDISTEDKRKMISMFAKDFTVLSEVGSKNPEVILKPSQWIEMIQGELDAGSWKVIAEARESGTVGMFNQDGGVRGDLIDVILDTIPSEKILWEAPLKSQQVWFIKLLGTNVNLGNIAPVDSIPLETLRLGLRGDTFHTFLGRD